MNSIIFRDVLLNMCLGLLALVMLASFTREEVSTAQVESPGNLIVNVSWESGNYDVDLWLLGPGELRAVGFSNKSGRVWNLLRDDTGNNDQTGLNYENAFSRGIPPGEYVVNVHSYRVDKYPMSVLVEVALSNSSGRPRVIVNRTVQLTLHGQEVTVVRFKIDDKGEVVPGSVHDAPIRLWESKK